MTAWIFIGAASAAPFARAHKAAAATSLLNNGAWF
jgi:hypothetical protein